LYSIHTQLAESFSLFAVRSRILPSASPHVPNKSTASVYFIDRCCVLLSTQKNSKTKFLAQYPIADRKCAKKPAFFGFKALKAFGCGQGGFRLAIRDIAEFTLQNFIVVFLYSVNLQYKLP
jgi:hypothetical protein